jgi:hypothetical protein
MELDVSLSITLKLDFGLRRLNGSHIRRSGPRFTGIEPDPLPQSLIRPLIHRFHHFRPGFIPFHRDRARFWHGFIEYREFHHFPSLFRLMLAWKDQLAAKFITFYHFIAVFILESLTLVEKIEWKIIRCQIA